MSDAKEVVLIFHASLGTSSKTNRDFVIIRRGDTQPDLTVDEWSFVE
jgi:hypothetical protein